MSGWEPIATAPKDGRYIIAGRFKEGGELLWVMHSRWITAEDAAEIDGGDPSDYIAGWAYGNDEEEPTYPSHWMALQAPTLGIAAGTDETAQPVRPVGQEPDPKGNAQQEDTP